jgi:hypothetical protein
VDDRACLFKIIDDDAAKTVGFYDSLEAAQTAGVRMHQDHPSIHFVLVSMNEKGVPLKFQSLRGSGSIVDHAADVVRAVTRRRLHRAVG